MNTAVTVSKHSIIDGEYVHGILHCPEDLLEAVEREEASVFSYVATG